MVQINILAFDIAEVVERFDQDTQINLFLFGATCVPEHTNKRYFV